MEFNFDNNVSIYIQIVEKIKIDIISGNLKPGDKLLSVREYALKFKVNPNTMQKSLMELEDIKLIYTDRTNGKYVTEDIKLINKYKNEYRETLTNNYFNAMENLGYSKEEIIDYIKKEKV